MENILCYEQETETIRQLPQNYLIAYKRHNEWICNPDLAADKELCNRVFNALLIYENKYGSGLNLLSEITPNKDFKMKLFPTNLLNTLLTQYNGFSFNPSTNKLNPKEGYFVSLPNAELAVSFEYFNPQILINFYNTNKELLLSNPKLFIGGWYNKEDDKIYLDISEQIESQSLAIRKGLLFDQKAIYDAVNDKVIYLPSRQKTGTSYQQETYIQIIIKQLIN